MTYTSNLNVCSIVEEKDCTGCSACMNICNHAAIQMVENEIGHILPAIDTEKCVDCSLCKKVCPSLNNKGLFKPIVKTYAAWAKDSEEHKTSTSGGVSSVLSRYVIKAGGVVYGCTCQRGCIIEHIRVEKVEELWRLKGSKYVQSNINNSYRKAEQDLKNGRIVLFTGTPCQIAGFKSFLRKDYSNLYTADIVCHGVPSQRLLFDHVESLGFKTIDIENVCFREEAGYYLTLKIDNKIVYRKNDLHDLYYSGFNDSLFSRKSCITCKYAQSNRSSDITMGDFHKLGRTITFDVQLEGNVSLLTVNSERGATILEEVRADFQLYERTFDEALSGNPQLRMPSVRKGDYENFVSLYTKFGYKMAALWSLRLRLLKNIILTIIYKIKI
ncbi:MAG: Coenzyme F420 hydrogenase/dehydrogenase, beta subunit C-terminal domain [Lachnospiraceae bacterium]|nr:Coenzyme F420 hydrogenase/dehydrogenase, beta subunit C-terminal domain [Lachnospiraceae bacterium]